MASHYSKFRIEHFDCQCWSYDHSIRFAFDPDEDDIRFAEVWVEACFPARYRWWQRLLVAAKYVWGGSRDWTYGSWIMAAEDEPRLRAFFRDWEAHIWKLKQKKLGENESTEEDSV